MSHPPSRADQVRMMGGGRGAKVESSPKMTAVDPENPNVRPDAWFVYVMPVQMGVELIGAGRYGYWDEQPDVMFKNDCIVITGKGGDSESSPIFIVPQATAISVHVCQAQHIQAMPFPVAEPRQEGN